MLNQPIKKSNHIETRVFQNTVVYSVLINVSRAPTPAGLGQVLSRATGFLCSSVWAAGKPSPSSDFPPSLYRLWADRMSREAACSR